VQRQANPGIIIAVAGNKVDLADSVRQVSEKEGQQLADENDVQVFMETSARTGHNVKELFKRLADKLPRGGSLAAPNAPKGEEKRKG